MKTAWKRTGAVLVSWLLLCLLALSASAVGPVEVLSLIHISEPTRP